MSRGPVVRYRVLTSGGVPSALLLLAWQVTVVPLGGFPWRGDFTWAVQVLGQGLLFLAPLFIAFASAPTALRGGAETTDALLMPVSPRRTLARRWLLELAPPMVVQLACLVTALAICLAAGGALEPSVLLTIGIQLAAVALYSTLGLAIGRSWRGPAALAGAALAGLALVAYGSHVLRVGGGRVPFVGLRGDSGGFWVALGVEAAAIGVLAAALAVERRPRIVRAVPWAVTLAVILAAAGTPGAIWSPSGARPDVCSTRTGVRVCVFAGYDRMLPATEVTLTRFVSAFRRTGVDPGITEIGQVVPGAPPEQRGVGRIMFQVDELDSAVVHPETVMEALTGPVWCPRLFDGDSPPLGNPERDVFVQAWLLHEVGAIRDVDFTGMAGDLGGRSNGEQNDLVRDFFADNLHCRGLG